MTTQPSVPYFVLRLENEDGVESLTCHRAKVLFTVPSELASSLASFPILCRGSSFALAVDDATMDEHATERNDRNSHHTTFLTTVLESPRPEDTAQDIAQRIAVRIEHIDSFQVATADGFLGF